MQSNNDVFYMDQALAQAKIAYTNHEVPIGALIVDNAGTIIAQTYNQVEGLHSQTAHAEIIALAEAGKQKGDWRLIDCTLYVTLEPCSMCMSALLLSRVRRLVFACASPVFGFRQDEYAVFEVERSPLTISQGVQEEEAKMLLQKFFKEKRVQS